MPGRNQAAQGEAAVLLAPEIEERLPMWRQRLLEINEAKQPAAPALNELRWRLGREMIETVAAPPAGHGRTAVMNALARRLGCSRPFIYGLIGVAESFSDELPEQQWSVLVILARMEAKAREQWLARLRPWAKVGDLPKRTRERTLTPQAQAALEERKASQRLVDEIRERFAQLREEDRPYLLLELLGKITLRSLPDYDQEDVLSRIERAVAALHNPAPGPAADGATLDGPNDSPA